MVWREHRQHEDESCGFRGLSVLHCGFPGPGPGSEQGSCVVYDEWIEGQEALLGDLWRYACWLELCWVLTLSKLDLYIGLPFINSCSMYLCS